MILNFLTRVIDERNDYDLEQTFFNVTHIQESPLELIIYLQRPDGTLDSLTFNKYNGNHHNMCLLNDNFKLLKQFDLCNLSFNNTPFVSHDSDGVNNEGIPVTEEEVDGIEQIEEDEKTVEIPEAFF